MLRRLLTAGVLSALTAAAVFGQPPPAPPALAADKTIDVAAPGVPGGKVKLVPRDQLRAGPGTKTARLPRQIRSLMGESQLNVPAVFDWTKGQTIKLPIMGNDRYGNCYYVAPAKLFIVYAANTGRPPVVFDLNALIRRYLSLSGGDNGLSDYQVFPEIKSGIIGPKGPHKALDVLIVPSNDKAALDLTLWAFGPHMFTFTVYENYSNGARPGAVFTGSSGRMMGGHAVVHSGKRANGNWQHETWGVQPSIEVSDSWVRSVDPEFIAVFSLEWFNDQGYAPNGEHYETLAPLWNSIGGKVPVPGPFPPPAKPVPTAKISAKPDSIQAGGTSVVTWETTNAQLVTLNGAPVERSGSMTVTPSSTATYNLTASAFNAVPATATATVTVGAPVPVGGTDTLTIDGATPAVDVAANLKAAGINPAVILALVKLIADIQAKAPLPTILADLLDLWAKLQGAQAQPVPNAVPMVPAPVKNVSVTPRLVPRPVLFPNRPIRRGLAGMADRFMLCP